MFLGCLSGLSWHDELVMESVSHPIAQRIFDNERVSFTVLVWRFKQKRFNSVSANNDFYQKEDPNAASIVKE